MALSFNSVKKATLLFSDIVTLTSFDTVARTEENQYDENKILGIDKKDDGGWESVFINIKKFSAEQLETWNLRKREVPNSASINEVQPGIIRLYFY